MYDYAILVEQFNGLDNQVLAYFNFFGIMVGSSLLMPLNI